MEITLQKTINLLSGELFNLGKVRRLDNLQLNLTTVGSSTFANLEAYIVIKRRNETYIEQKSGIIMDETVMIVNLVPEATQIQGITFINVIFTDENNRITTQKLYYTVEDILDEELTMSNDKYLETIVELDQLVEKVDEELKQYEIKVLDISTDIEILNNKLKSIDVNAVVENCNKLINENDNAVKNIQSIIEENSKSINNIKRLTEENERAENNIDSLNYSDLIDISSFKILDNKIVIDKPISIDGESYNNKNGNFNFYSKYILKVSDEFPRGEKVLNFYNFDNLNIKNLSIEGNLKQNGTIFTSGEYVLTTSDKWEDTIQPLWISDCKNVKLDNIISTDHSGCGISTKRVNNVTIKDCNISNCFQHGIFVGISNNKVLIDNCRCTAFGDLGYEINKNIGGIGILVSESNNPTISNNRIIGFSDTGTKTEGCSHVKYINNYIDSFGKDGLKIMGYNENSVNVEDCKVIHNYIKNKFNGRSDGTSYIAFHEVINGTIDGNIIIKDITNDAPRDDGIRINILDGKSSKNIKVINNTIKINSNSPGINVHSNIDNAVKEILIKNNRLNRSIQINNINKVLIINNTIIESKYLDTKISIIKSSNLIIDKNIIDGLGESDSYDAIYIQPNQCEYIRVTDNIIKNCGGRFLRITEGSDNKIIDFLDIKGNKVEFGMGNISYPICGIYLGMNNTTINECNILNNTFTTPKIFTDTSLYWAHPFSNFNIKLTRLENLILNGDNAITNLQSQFGRVIGEVYSSIKPNYIDKFKAYDEIKNINPTLDNIKWIFNGSEWVVR